MTSHRITLALIALYAVFCSISPLISFSPAYLYDWKLFVNWSSDESEFFDIAYTQQGETKFASRNSRYFLDRGVNMISAFDRFLHGDDSYFDRIQEPFAKACDCDSFELVKIRGTLGEHVLFNRRVSITTWKHGNAE